MRANSDRSLRLAFDAIPDQYDAARPRFIGAPVVDLVSHTGVQSGDCVLEIGAGTGQLTVALVGARLRVVALEPAPNLAAKLRSNLVGHGDLVDVEEVLFEDFECGDRRFAAVVSANAFHWIDPGVSYSKASSVLATGGSLALLWNFPILADGALQQEVNAEAFVDDLADLARDPESFVPGLDELLEAGRSELAASGCFEVPWWRRYVETLVLDVDRYVGLLGSLANGIEVGPLIRGRLEPLLSSVDRVEVANHIYLSVARAM